MNAMLLRALQVRRPQIRERWEALLRLERAQTPLGNPDTLVFMFDQTLDEVLAERPVHPAASVRARPECQCDCNPMRAYFPALEQALLEALVLVQAEQPAFSPDERVAAVTELCGTLRRIARREIAAFDGLCQQKAKKPAEA